MNIREIVKESFLFPTKDLNKLSTYVLLTGVMVFLGIWGLIYSIFPFETIYQVLGVILIFCTLCLYFILSGYRVTILKSGINNSENVPSFNFKDNLLDGIKLVIINIVYCIIPLLITVFVGILTGIPHLLVQLLNACEPLLKLDITNSTSFTNTMNSLSTPAVQQIFNNVMNAIVITIIVCIILFIIFAFIKAMGEARFANTNSLVKGLNVIQSLRDIIAIGFKKVILSLIAVWGITIIISSILGYLSSLSPIFSIILVIIDAYLVIYCYRAVGVIYSDINHPNSNRN